MRRIAIAVALCLSLGVRAEAQMGGMAMPSHETPASTAKWKATVERGSLVLELDPIVLPAMAMHDDIAQPAPMAVPAGVDGWLHGYSIELTDSAGRPVPQTVIHHVNVIVPQKRELFSQIMLRLAAAGAETAPVGLPWFLGFPVERTDTLLMTAMFHNPTATNYGPVTLKVRMPLTQKRMFGSMAIYPFYMDVMPPAGSHSFDVPAGRSEHFWEGSPAVHGRILGLSGHMHQYGVLLRLEDRTSGKVIWEGRPKVDARGEVEAMPIKKFVATFGVGVQPDHVYRLTVVYDNPTGATIVDGGMGALGGVFLPRDSRGWPAVDRTNPDYVLDWRITNRLDTSRDVHGGH